MAAADVNLSVKVQGDEIVVTLPGTSYVVTYYRAAAFPQRLLTKSHSGREDEDAPMTQASFTPAPGRRQGTSIGVDRVKKCDVVGADMVASLLLSGAERDALALRLVGSSRSPWLNYDLPPGM